MNVPFVNFLPMEKELDKELKAGKNPIPPKMLDEDLENKIKQLESSNADKSLKDDNENKL